MKRKYLSRRTFLRGSLAGVGLSLAVPPLEAMLNSRGAYADGEGEKPFFALFFWANGMPWHDGHGDVQSGHPDLWTPANTGENYTPSQLLAPLADHRVNVATGLTPVTAIPSTPGGQGDGHMRGFMVALTGDRPRSEGFDHPSHTLTALRPTLDQLVARHDSFYTEQPKFRSLPVGISNARFHDYGHWNAISYGGPDSPIAPIREPSQLFDLMFAIPPNTSEVDRQSAALDAVLEDARALENRLGTRDRERLQAHLEHIFEIQSRLGVGGGLCEKPSRPSNGGSLLTRTRAMSELLALAVNCGQTQVVSFMLTSPATTHVFSNLSSSDAMHKVCHDGGWDQVRDITRHQMEAFATFLDAFAAVEQPGGGNLLDRGCVYGTSEYGEGFQHSVKEMPVIIAGGACGRLNSNIHVREPGGNISKAQLTVLKALGLPFNSFGFNGGETSSTLPGLLV